MSPKKLGLAALALVVAVGGFLFYQDVQFRKEHGRVHTISILDWEKEVEQVSKDKPVLVYFRQAPDDAQRKVVEELAWDTAGDVKVVVVDCDQLGNLLFATAAGITKYPTFVVDYHGTEITASPKPPSVASEKELLRLIEQATK